MKKLLMMFLCLLMTVTLFVIPASAENPTVQTSFTCDPAPLVYDGVFYLYAGRDADNATEFNIPEYRCYSTTDMKNYTDHGAVLSWEDFSWAAENSCWASQCVERDGKFYMFVTLQLKDNSGRGIGVAVSDSPTGPFKDALGEPLFGPHWEYIDPTILIDDDGQAYCYWGNPRLYYSKLNEDMIHTDDSVHITNMTTEAFGTREGSTNPQRNTLYEEGPWIYKRNGVYYMVYAASGVPETIDYSTSDSPTGPWKYQGRIMDISPTSFTIHPSIIEYEDRAYFVYHTGYLPIGGGGFTRSAAIEEFTFNDDGTIPFIAPTSEGPEQIRNFNPYNKIPAATMSWSEGLKVEQNENVGVYLTKTSNGDYLKVSGVQFSTGANKFTASVSAPVNEGTVELHIDSVDGSLIGKIDVPATGDEWKEISCDINGANGVHDLYMVFKCDESVEESVNMNWWQFEGEVSPDDFPETEASTDDFSDTDASTDDFSDTIMSESESESSDKISGTNTVLVIVISAVIIIAFVTAIVVFFYKKRA